MTRAVGARPPRGARPRRPPRPSGSTRARRRVTAATSCSSDQAGVQAEHGRGHAGGRGASGVEEAGRDARAEGDVRVERVAPRQRVVVRKRRRASGPPHRAGAAEPERALLDPWIDVRARAERHHEARPIAEPLQHLRQRLDPLPAEPPAEPAAGVEAASAPGPCARAPVLGRSSFAPGGRRGRRPAAGPAVSWTSSHRASAPAATAAS